MVIKALPNSIFPLYFPLGTSMGGAAVRQQALCLTSTLSWLWIGPRLLFLCEEEDSRHSCVLREGHWYTGVIDGGIMATYSYNLPVSSRPVEVWLPIDYFHYMADCSHGIDIQLTKLGCFHNIQLMLGRSGCTSTCAMPEWLSLCCRR